jgi:HPt (histidine-containing phosphotransfer) domain-containing protein
MTASAMTQDREAAMEAGMDDHVAKPIDTRELFSTLVRWIKPGMCEIPVAIEEDIREDATDEDKVKDVEGTILPSALPGISIKTGLSRVGGNQRFYRKLLGKFLASNANAVEDIKDALDKGDTETAARLAHTVKGVAGNLGANDLFPVAGDLEKGIKQGETDALDSLIEAFASHLDVVMGGIRALEENEAASKKEEVPTDESPIDVDTVKPLLQEMAQLLEIDIMGAMSRLEAIRLHLDRSVAWEPFKRLEKCVERFDMDGAKDSLLEISDVLEITLE